MNNILLRSTLVFIGLIQFQTLIAQRPPFTVKDDIEMIRFNDPRPISGEGNDSSTKYSPDGRWVAVVTTKGLLEKNLVKSSISLFDVRLAKEFVDSAQRGAIPPRVVAQVTSFPHHNETDSYAPVIKDLHWSSDSSRLLFRGEDIDGFYRLYSVHIDGRDLRPLTPSGRDVRRFEVSKDVIVYKARDNSDEYPVGSLKNTVSEAVDGGSLPEILFPFENRSMLARKWKLWTIRPHNGVEHTTLVQNYAVRSPESTSASSFWDPIAISPQGDRIIVLTPVRAIAASWANYDPSVGHESMRYRPDDPALLDDNNQMRPREYTLVDLRTGVQTSLLRSPEGISLGYLDNDQVIWSSDGRRVLLTNTFMPRGPDGLNTVPCAIASVDLPSFQSNCLIYNVERAKNFTGDIFSGAVHLRFGSSNDQILISYRHDHRMVSKQFEYENGTWKSSSIERTGITSPQPRNDTEAIENSGQPMQFVVKQGLNDPPKLWATDSERGTSKILWNPNPQLANLRFGEASVFKWIDRTGREWRGGLVKPIDFVAGRRYPLVIQLYEFDSHEFLTDGSWPTAFAARHLASAGILVLQVEKDMVMKGADEANEHLEAYRSAIDKLSEAGLADPNKVGVVGFSTTSWYAENALITCPHMFAAATIADGLDHSYMQYHLADERTVALQRMDEEIVGAKPIRDGLKKWLDIAPGFNLDRIETPLRVEAIKPFSLLGEWEIYSSLKMQHKPVDLIYFPSSQHIHQRPLARFDSQQGNVDWMRYWLQGYEDPDPKKAAQYRRWERLRGNVAAPALQ